MPYSMTAPARIKAVGAEQDSGLEGAQFRALVAVFGNVDSVGDRILPGAFTDTLVDWQSRGDPIPLVWSHRWDDPFSNIGHVLTAAETSDGLEVVGELDVEDNPTARYVHKLLKTRRINQFSFAYDIDDAQWVKSGDDDSGSETDVLELKKLSVFEVGPCLVGANRETELREIKRAVDRTNLAVRQAISPKGSSRQAATSRDDSADDARASGARESTPPRARSASDVLALVNSYMIGV